MDTEHELKALGFKVSRLLKSEVAQFLTEWGNAFLLWDVFGRHHEDWVTHLHAIEIFRSGVVQCDRRNQATDTYTSLSSNGEPWIISFDKVVSRSTLVIESDRYLTYEECYRYGGVDTFIYPRSMSWTFALSKECNNPEAYFAWPIDRSSFLKKR